MTDDVRSFLTVAMIAVGSLILAVSGPCTAFYAIGSLVDLAQGRSGGEFPPDFILAAAGLLGGPPILVGGVLIWGGLRLRRRPKSPKPKT